MSELDELLLSATKKRPRTNTEEENGEPPAKRRNYNELDGIVDNEEYDDEEFEDDDEEEEDFDEAGNDLEAQQRLLEDYDKARRKQKLNETRSRTKAPLSKQEALSDISSKRKSHQKESAVRKKEKSKPAKASTNQNFTNPERGHPAKTEEPKYNYNISLDTISKIRIRRYQLDKWIDQPYFANIIEGCFVRLSIGESEQGRPMYRLAEVDRVIDKDRTYQTDGRKITNKYLRVKFGNRKKDFPINLVSNSEISVNEFTAWLEAARKHHESVPSEEFVKDKITSIKNTTQNYTYSEEDVSRMVENKNRYRKKTQKELSQEKLRLLNLRDAYKQDGKDEAYNDVCNRLEEINEQLETYERKKRSTFSIVNIDNINQRNRVQNMGRQREHVKSQKLKNDLNPFSRIKEDNGFFWLDDPEEESSKSQESNKEEDQDNVPKTPEEQKKALEKKRKEIENAGSLLAEAHSFDLNLDLNLEQENEEAPKPLFPVPPAPVRNGSQTSTASSAAESGKKSLSLADYKRKKKMM